MEEKRIIVLGFCHTVADMFAQNLTLQYLQNAKSLSLLGLLYATLLLCMVIKYRIYTVGVSHSWLMLG